MFIVRCHGIYSCIITAKIIAINFQTIELFCDNIALKTTVSVRQSILYHIQQKLSVKDHNIDIHVSFCFVSNFRGNFDFIHPTVFICADEHIMFCFFHFLKMSDHCNIGVFILVKCDNIGNIQPCHSVAIGKDYIFLLTTGEKARYTFEGLKPSRIDLFAFVGKGREKDNSPVFTSQIPILAAAKMID